MKKTIAFSLLGLFLGLVVLAIAGPAQADRGQSIFDDKCAMCHGRDGKGNGPAAGGFSPSPADFTNPAFWQGDYRAKITDTIDNGKGVMPPVDLSSGQIKAVIDYMSHAFK
jgi:mono/diheme cytochrome c family protein